ncbi:MAG: hypothetical protein IT305_13455 [Chloroflexi bacterium]|nr:hypothetical protein [Chloroflexota bacterium]
MEHRIVWVHGIGDHQAGYSDEWRLNFNQHLHLPDSDFIEVLWDTVFDAIPGTTRSAAAATTRGAVIVVAPPRAELGLTPTETLAAQEIQDELTTILQARKVALDRAERAVAAPSTRSADADAVVAWAASPVDADVATTRGLLTWLLNPEEYLGDFVKYLVSRSIRTAVKACFKERLLPLIGSDAAIAVVSHSWGTVVAYDSLLDLSAEAPDLDVLDLFTLGSPLWMVRRFLEDSSGGKPSDVASWVNVTAQGDPVGAWLRPAFAVDDDLHVPGIDGVDAHGSYFAAGNAIVQRDIVARDILD